MPSEDLTFALALIGTITGSASAATGIYTAARDRPRLRTNFGVTTRLNQAPRSYIDVTNEGHRATTVREVGLYARSIDFGVARRGETPSQLVGEVTWHEGPVFLEPGQSQRVEITPNIDTFGIHADFPLRTYAKDVRGRYVWGNAAPVVRMLVGDNPPMGDDDPDDFKALFYPPRPDLLPARVEPRWKLWKRRELRQPSAWRKL